MQTVWLVASLLGLGSGMAVAQSAALGLYNEANALYRQGEFQAARDRYHQVVQTGTQNAQLYYNLGNASFKANQLGEAILWYERALRLEPRDADIQANLRFANRIKRDKDPELEENPVVRFFVDVYLLPTLNELSLAFSLTAFLLLALASWRLWSREGTRVVWLVLILGCCTMTVATGLFLGARIYRHGHLSEAIVTVGEGIARSAPDQGQTVVFLVHEGTKVKVDRQERNWLLIRLPNGLGGWLPASAVTVI